MNFPLFIARRYLFSKKSHNAINVISIISVTGIAIATMAMVCVLSVFNGFGGIVEEMFSAFDPDLKIKAKAGKVFNYDTPAFTKALTHESVLLFSETLEENALFKFEEQQIPVVLKGVSEEFSLITDMEQVMADGRFHLTDGDVDYTVLGIGLAATLNARVGFINPIEVYAPKRDVTVNLANPTSAFLQDYLMISGVFRLNQIDIDDQVAIVPIHLARKLFRYDDEVSSLDLQLRAGVSVKRVKKELRAILGDDFVVEDRYEQQSESFRMLQIEKWVTFLILAFIVLIAIFNVVGSLSMLIVEKGEDIKSLRNMGADNDLITRIFLFEGWLIALIGIIAGIAVGIALCLIQQYFGVIKLGTVPGEFIVDAYPVIVKFWDIVLIFLIVAFISLLTIFYPIYTLKKKLVLSQ